MAKKKKYYVVWQGHEPGIYESWTECQRQIKAYPNAKYKAFESRTEAEEAFHGNFSEFIGRNKKAKPKRSQPNDDRRQEIIWDSIAVDAVPWSVPEPLSSTRRPNSLVVHTSVERSCPRWPSSA